MEKSSDGARTPNSTLSADRSVGDPDHDPGGSSELTKNRAEESRAASSSVNNIHNGDGDDDDVAEGDIVVPDAFVALSDGDIDWAATHQEVDDFLNESDEDEDDGKSERDEDDGWTEDSNYSDIRYGKSFVDIVDLADLVHFSSSAPPTPRKNRKRQRSSTPSGSGTNSAINSDDEGSPLSKRKKLSQSRRGASQLKIDISTHVLEDLEDGDSSSSSSSSDENGQEDDDEDEDMDDDLEDFLMKGLENGAETDDGDDEGDGDDNEWG